MTAFICGLLGLLPIIGLVPAVCAIGYWMRVRSRYRNEWNPASLYLNWSAVLGVLGIFIAALATAIIAMCIISSYSP